MNEALTREVLEAMKKCSFSCALCDANGVCDKYNWQDTIQTLATALLEERARPKVWAYAPDDAIQAQIKWFDKNGSFSGIKTYTRELPKTRTREIAENIVHGINGATRGEARDIEYVEGVLKRYAEELEGKE